MSERFLESVFLLILCFAFGVSNKLDSIWASNVDCPATYQNPCELFSDICKEGEQCMPKLCSFTCLCPAGAPCQSGQSSAVSSSSSGGQDNGKRLDSIVGNGAFSFLDSLLKNTTQGNNAETRSQPTTVVGTTDAQKVVTTSLPPTTSVTTATVLLGVLSPPSVPVFQPFVSPMAPDHSKDLQPDEASETQDFAAPENATANEMPQTSVNVSENVGSTSSSLSNDVNSSIPKETGIADTSETVPPITNNTESVSNISDIANNTQQDASSSVRSEAILEMGATASNESAPATADISTEFTTSSPLLAASSSNSSATTVDLSSNSSTTEQSMNTTTPTVQKEEPQTTASPTTNAASVALKTNETNANQPHAIEPVISTLNYTATQMTTTESVTPESTSRVASTTTAEENVERESLSAPPLAQETMDPQEAISAFWTHLARLTQSIAPLQSLSPLQNTDPPTTETPPSEVDQPTESEASFESGKTDIVSDTTQTNAKILAQSEASTANISSDSASPSSTDVSAIHGGNTSTTSVSDSAIQDGADNNTAESGLQNTSLQMNTMDAADNLTSTPVKNDTEAQIVATRTNVQSPGQESTILTPMTLSQDTITTTTAATPAPPTTDTTTASPTAQEPESSTEGIILSGAAAPNSKSVKGKPKYKPETPTTKPPPPADDPKNKKGSKTGDGLLGGDELITLLPPIPSSSAINIIIPTESEIPTNQENMLFGEKKPEIVFGQGDQPKLSKGFRLQHDGSLENDNSLLASDIIRNDAFSKGHMKRQGQILKDLAEETLPVIPTASSLLSSDPVPESQTVVPTTTETWQSTDYMDNANDDNSKEDQSDDDSPNSETSNAPEVTSEARETSNPAAAFSQTSEPETFYTTDDDSTDDGKTSDISDSSTTPIPTTNARSQSDDSDTNTDKTKKAKRSTKDFKRYLFRGGRNSP